MEQKIVCNKIIYLYTIKLEHAMNLASVILAKTGKLSCEMHKTNGKSPTFVSALHEILKDIQPDRPLCTPIHLLMDVCALRQLKMAPKIPRDNFASINCQIRYVSHVYCCKFG